ncbi:MAG TPA: tetratricopeptide repeat protein [Verrucomicrobiae bacterium]
MTAEPSPKLERQFVQNSLPCVVGAAALAVYLATLNHWVTLSSLPLVARVNGWDWQPMLSQPLLCLLTFPFRWLPASWVPLALNVFAAVCASLTLATLARSVALLPHDRMEQQRLLVQNEHALLSLPNAWVPVVLAAIALGLQLTFWEHAIAASGEMLDLLVFAYIIRCLLEHRVDEQPSWLDRAALLFGCAMANNWGMVGFLPLFLVALLRTKRLSFFSLRTIRRIDRSGWERVAPALTTDLRFFLRMALLGLAGSSLFLLLPLAQAFSPGSTLSFWQALHTVATSYWDTLHLLARVFLRSHRDVALLLAAASLLPILLLSIRWGAFVGGESHARFDLASFILHVSHAFLLLICLSSVFDPPFGPRQVARQTGLLLPFLPLYYLTALSIGYYSGFFLLMFGAAAFQRTGRRNTVRRFLCRVVPILVYVLLCLVLAGLPLLNLPAIRATNAPHLDQYARLAAGSLPPEGAVVLSDDPAHLAFLQAELAREGKAGRYLPVETRNLPLAPYRAWLSRKNPGRWPDPGIEAEPAVAGRMASQTNAPLDGPGLVRLMFRVAQSNRVCCLQPGVGFLLEQFYLQPHGLLHEMKSYPGDFLSDPPLTDAGLAENQAFWKSALETGVRPVLRLVSQPELPRPAFEERLMKLGHLQTPPPAQARVLARWYSGALNRWGVTLQRNGRWSEATPCFALALELNSDNLPAFVNLQCNSNLLAHQKMTVVRTQVFPEQLGRYRSLNQVLTENGPFDEPSYCYRLGMGFAEGKMRRQAGQQFDRVKALVPSDFSVRLTLGNLFNTCSRPELALGIVAEMQADPELRPLGLTNEVEVALLEARAYLTATNQATAQGIIYALLATHPGDSALLARAVTTFADYQCYSDAIRLTDHQLQLTPDDPAALANKGILCVLTGDSSNAIPTLTRSLSLTNTYVARLNRAIAYLRTGRLDAAEADYQALLQQFPTAYRVSAMLGEVALQRKDTNTAIRYYEQYLSKLEPDTEEARFVAVRLKSLQQGGP